MPWQGGSFTHTVAGVRARDLVERVPTVRLDADAWDAARLIAERRLPGVVIVDERDRPCCVLTGPEALRFVLPSYLLDDPALARVMDERSAEALCGERHDRTVGEVVADRGRPLPLVEEDTTLVEIAVLMARERSPVVAVVADGVLLGTITAPRVLGALQSAGSA
jgi:CBS domain-containing protein